jgi:hypothetical protein
MRTKTIHTLLLIFSLNIICLAGISEPINNEYGIIRCGSSGSVRFWFNSDTEIQSIVWSWSGGSLNGSLFSNNDSYFIYGSLATQSSYHAPYSLKVTYKNGTVITRNITADGVTIATVPTVTASINTALVCSGEKVTLAATGAGILGTYSWSGTNGFSTLGNPVIDRPTTTTIYTVIGTNINGCSSNAQVTANIPVIGASSNTVCSGQTLTLYVNTMPVGSSYQWSLNGKSILGATNNTYNTNEEGRYTVAITFGGLTCISPSFTLTVKKQITVNVNPANGVLCPGESVQLTASGADNYIWTPTTGLTYIDKKNSIVNASPLISTTYSVTGYASSNNTCPGTTSVTVTVNPFVADFVPVTPNVNLNSGNSTVLRAGAAGLSFDGVDDYVDGGNLGTFPDKGAITFWMDASVVENFRNPFTTNYLGGNSGIRFEESTIDSKGFATVFGDDVGNYQVHTYFDVNEMKSNKWYHIILTWDKTQNKVAGYINGVQKFEDSQIYWPSNLPFVAILGNGYNPNRYYKGLMDDVGIYSSYLSTPSEIFSAMQTPSVFSNVIAFWGMPEGTGLSTADLSGHGHTAYLKNGTSWVTFTSPVTYTWSPTSGLSNTTGESVIANPSSSTTYTVTATATGYCASTATISVNVGNFRMAAMDQTQINSIDNNNISAYPNPASGNLTVSVTGGTNYKVEILDMQGRVLNEYNSTEETMNINVSNLHTGLYLFQITQNGIRTRKKMEIVN